MKITKRLLSLVLAIAVVLSCMVIPMASSAEGTVTIGNATGAPGETVKIVVTATGTITNSCGFQLIIDGSEIGTFTGYEYDTLTQMNDEGGNVAVLPKTEIRVMPFTDDLEGFDLNGTLCTLEFTINEDAAPGTYTLKVADNDGDGTPDVLMPDADFNEFYYPVAQPTVTVTGASEGGDDEDTVPTTDGVHIMSTSGNPGETVSIKVYAVGTITNSCGFQLIMDGAEIGTFTGYSYDTLTQMNDEGGNVAVLPKTEIRVMPFTDDLEGFDLNGLLCTLEFTINADATPGVYTLKVADNDGDGTPDVLMPDADFNEFYYAVEEPTVTVLGDAPAEKFDITVGTVANGTVVVDKASAEAGETVTVTATPNEGYMLNTILVDGQAISGNTFTVTGAHEVTATFDLIPPSVYTVSVGAVQNGKVAVSADSAEEGTTITVTATPNEHYALDKIYVNGVAINGNTFTLTENAVVTATFTAIQYNITVGAVENGTVTVDKATAVAGATVTVTATAASGFKTAAIFVNGVQINGSTFTVEGDAEVTATFTEVQGILISANKVGYTNQDLVYQGDTDVTIDITVSNNTEKLSEINFIVDLQDGLADLEFGSVTAWEEITVTNIPTGASYTAVVLDDGTILVNLYYLDADAGYSDNGVIATLSISTITAASGEYEVALSQVDAWNTTANQVDGETENGSVLVTAYVTEVTIKDANGNDFVVEVLDTMTTAEKIAEVQAALPNAVITIIYNDGTTAEIAYADVTDDLTTVVNDSYTSGTANVTLTYTQSKCPAGKETVTDVYYVNIAIDSAPESITVEGPLYFPYGDEFAWGDTEYTITYESDSVQDQTNVVTSGLGTGTIVADGVENLDNTDTAAQKVTVTINGTNISTTVDVYFVIPTITIESTSRYYEEGATFALSNHSAIITATYSAESGLGTVTVDAADVTVGTASTTLADTVTAEARSVSVTYQGASDDVEYVVVDLDRVGKVVGRVLTITEAEFALLDLINPGAAYANNGRGLLNGGDFVQVRNISIRK